MKKHLRKRRRTKKKSNFWIWAVLIVLILGLIFGMKQFSSSGESKDAKRVQLYVNSLPYGVDSNISKAINDAKLFWESRGEAVFVQEPPVQLSNVSLIWVRDFREEINHTPSQNVVRIGLGDSKCGPWKPYTYDTIRIIAIHQLGHLIGKIDSDDKKDIMYKAVRTIYQEDLSQSGTLSDGRSAYYPVCDGNVSKRYLFEVTSSEDVDVIVVQSTRDYELMLNNQDFFEYSCGQDRVRIFSESCEVFGAGIIIKNPSNNNQGLKADYKLKIKEI